MTTETTIHDALYAVMGDDVPDDALPALIDAARIWLDQREHQSPACQRANAEALAHDIARSPCLYRHDIGADDRIRDTEYRMQDFIPESGLANYRTYCYGSPEATDEHPQDDEPPQVEDCTGNCAGGHWGPDGREWHYTAQGRRLLEPA